jgi:hypothetical protein
MSLPIFPTHILPSALKFRLVPHSGYSQAPNRMVEVWQKPSAYWEFSGQWSRVRYTPAREARVFIDNLEGSAYEFLMWDSTHTQLGNWGGTVRVDGINQTGTLLHIDGATPHAMIAPAGDRFQLDDYLYSLRVDAVADANGECDLLINPQLMTLPTDNTVLIHDNPMCKMMLPDDKQGPDFSKRSLVVTNFSIAGFMSMRN